MANANRYYKTPFAESGNKAEVPNVSVGGAVGYDSGFGPDYELPQGSPSRKRIERDLYNGMHFGITKNLKQWQEGLYPTWIEDDGSGVAFSYPQGMIVNHAGQDWISDEDANQEEPGAGFKWSVFRNLAGDPVLSATLDEAVANKRVIDGDRVIISDRADGLFEYKTGQTPNGYDIVACTGVPALSLVLKVRDDALNLKALGCVFDGVSDCYPAYVRAKEIVGTGTIQIYGSAGEICQFETYPNAADILEGPLFDVSPNVLWRVKQINGLTPTYGNGTIRVVRTTRIFEQFTDTNIYISPQTSAHVQDKLNWLSANDADNTVVSAYDMTTEVIAKKVDWDGAGDTFDADVYSATTPSSIQLNTAHDGYIHLGMVKLLAGEQVTCAFSAFNNTDTAVVMMVSCQGGYYGIRGSNVSSIMTQFEKQIGQARIEVNANTEASPFSQYRLPVSSVTIKVHDLRHFSMCVNGVSFYDVETTSDIMECGVGAYDLGASATILTMNDFVKVIAAPKVSGVRALTIATFGDSITAGDGVQHVYGSWPEQLKRRLDGAAGVRVKSVNNFAVSGATSGTQLPLVTPANLSGADYAIFMLGTNDIQGGVLLSTYLSNMQTMIQTALDEGVRVLVGVPPMFYTQSDAATVTGNASGNATTNSASGAVYRSGLIRLCATLGVKVVDTLGGLGSVIATYLDTANYLDSIVTDNIHPTTYGRMLFADMYAKAIIGDIGSAKNVSEYGVMLPSSGLLNGAAFTTEPPKFSFNSDSGVVDFVGVIDVPAATPNGTSIYTLPLHLRPKSSLRFVNFNGELGNSNLLIGSDGSVSIYNAPTAATFVTMQMTYNIK